MPRFLSLPLLDGTLDCRAMGAAAIRWITLFGLVCFGQTPYKKAPPSPLDLFVNAESGTAPASAPLSVLYGLLRRQPDGAFAGVDPKAAVFHAGDRVRLRILARGGGPRRERPGVPAGGGRQAVQFFGNRRLCGGRSEG